MIEKYTFGHTSANQEAFLYIITNKNGMTASLTDYGAALTSLQIPVSGQVLDVVLGYDSVTSYEQNKGQLGATVGRNANRMQNASFTLNGHTYQLQKDPHGNNSHSGPDYYNKRIWHADYLGKDASSVHFNLNSPHMDQGFPGCLALTVTYTLTDRNSLIIRYDALCDKDTILNVTNHSYFNLNGHAGGSVLSHKLWIDANSVTQTDAHGIPTGQLLPVAGTAFDFTVKRYVTEAYDDNWCLNNHDKYKLCATLESPVTGLSMDMYTDLPGVQIYTANGLTGIAGKQGAIYQPYSGICMETQYFVNAMNIPAFKQPFLKADTPYCTCTEYLFTGLS